MGVPGLISTKRLATIAGVSSNVIHNDIAAGLLSPTLKDGGANYYSHVEVRQYMAYRRCPLDSGLKRISRRVQIRTSIAQHGIEYTAMLFGIKADSLKRNLRNWRKR